MNAPTNQVCLTLCVDIAGVGKKVVEFYKKKGGEIVSPLVKAFVL